jgi:hypothetical protein
MKRLLFSFIFASALVSGASGFAQSPNSTAVHAFSYQMQQDGGTNGSGVAYDANSKTYFVAIAGNSSFPLESFKVNGKTATTIQANEAGEDLRGLWCDPKVHALQANLAGDGGWVSRAVASNGNVGPWKSLAGGQNQPEFQSVGTYDAKKKAVLFYDASNYQLELRKTKSPSSFKAISLDANEVNPEDFNATSVGYTGVKGYEYALLDFNNSRLVYFNSKGKVAGSTKLPNDAPVYDYFAFGIANGKLFLYNKEARVWHAYEIF